jgi:hypothetical protein
MDMIRPEDQRAIDDLFDRLRRVEGNSGPRDPDAEAMIRRHLTENPAAAYYMAQAVIVQEAALREQQARIEELERKPSSDGLGFLDSIFGDDPPKEERQQSRRSPWDRPESGGFLAGAAQTALGVTGGLLLGSAIAGMFSSQATADEQSLPDDPAGEDDIDDGGGDWGGFDTGGGF